MGALAEFERQLIVERTQTGLAAARARGRHGGRPRKVDEAKAALIRQLYESREHPSTRSPGWSESGAPRCTAFLETTDRAVRPRRAHTAKRVKHSARGATKSLSSTIRGRDVTTSREAVCLTSTHDLRNVAATLAIAGNPLTIDNLRVGADSR